MRSSNLIAVDFSGNNKLERPELQAVKRVEEIDKLLLRARLVLARKGDYVPELTATLRQLQSLLPAKFEWGKPEPLTGLPAKLFLEVKGKVTGIFKIIASQRLPHAECFHGNQSGAVLESVKVVQKIIAGHLKQIKEGLAPARMPPHPR